MPVPYSPPNVEAYTRKQPFFLFFLRGGRIFFLYRTCQSKRVRPNYCDTKIVKINREIAAVWTVGVGRSYGRRVHDDKKQKLTRSWNQTKIITICLLCHIYCAQHLLSKLLRLTAQLTIHDPGTQQKLLQFAFCVISIALSICYRNCWGAQSVKVQFFAILD